LWGGSADKISESAGAAKRPENFDAGRVFLSVLKSKRSLSKLEFYHNARKLRKDITELLLRDFGVRDKVRKIKTEGNMELTIIDEFPNWLIIEFRNNVLRLLHNLIMNITAGNTIYPTIPEEITVRRRYQTAAIVNCEQLLQELMYCSDVLPLGLEKFTPFVDAIEFEIRLLKGWRKSTNKMADDLEKKSVKETEQLKK
jgi:hypothetical protein